MTKRKKTRRQYQKLQHWAKQWKTNRPAMLANLGALIASRKALKAQKVSRVGAVLQSLPQAFPASQSKQLMGEALRLAGAEPTAARLKRLRVYAVRYGFLKYDSADKCWHKTI
jgi:hypothetical protein